MNATYEDLDMIDLHVHDKNDAAADFGDELLP
jgi:hypothetical protein